MQRNAMQSEEYETIQAEKRIVRTINRPEHLVCTTSKMDIYTCERLHSTHEIATTLPPNPYSILKRAPIFLPDGADYFPPASPSALVTTNLEGEEKHH